MPRRILFTQCLQNDFVAPVPPGATVPNQLHIGREESRRLVGEDPKAGPLGRFLQAFYAGATPEHAVVHIRDWHDAADPAQAHHLAHFGPHCLRGRRGRIRGAAGGTERCRRADGHGELDGAERFRRHGPEEQLLALLGGAAPYVTAGIIGVWTDVRCSTWRTTCSRASASATSSCAARSRPAGRACGTSRRSTCWRRISACASWTAFRSSSGRWESARSRRSRRRRGTA